MAEPTPIAPPEHVGDVLVYRPVSGSAIGGLALSLLYTVLVVISTAVALVQGAPMFLPDLTVLLAVAGAGLSLLAMWHIRSSEGTRAGLKAAQWGLWLSVVAGLGYMAYTTATAAAIKQQANRFLTEQGEDAGFFPLLEKGEVNEAFLLTQTYSRRTGANARNNEGMRRQFDAPTGPHPTGWLTQFSESLLVRIFEQARLRKDPVTVEPATVRGWSFETKGYKVERVYRIATPETIADVLVIVQSVENDGTGAGRKWFVVWTNSGILGSQDSPAGEKMSQLRWDARGFVEAWLAKLNQGQRGEAFLDIVEPDKRAAAKKWATPTHPWWWAFPGTGPAGAVAGMPLSIPPIPLPLDDELARRAFLPGYEEFCRGQPYLKTGNLRAPQGEAARIRTDFEHAFQEVGTTRLRLQLKLADAKLALWDMAGDGRLQITQAFQMPLVQDMPGNPPRFQGKGHIVVETAVGGDPRSVEFKPEWRLVRVELERALPMPAQRPGPGG